MKQTAVIYARVSSVTDRQDTQRQVQDLLKYAQAQDIEVVHIFEEHISYLQRAVNATELSVGINDTLRGVNDKYAWFLS